jgi:hypothetical protein
MHRYFIFLSLFLASCASIKTVEPLKKGEVKATADLGGPMINFNGIPLFMPLTSIGSAMGISDNVSVFASIHTTSLMYKTFQLETSANTSLFRFDKAVFRPIGVLILFVDYAKANGHFILMLILITIYITTTKLILHYFSFTSMMELHRKKAFDEPVTKRIIPHLTLGHRWVKDNSEWGLELKYLSFNKDNRNIVVDYIAPGNKGSFGFYLSYAKKF